jgi:hypothetical protein
MAFTREQVPIVTTGAVYYPALAQRIVELTMPALALKPLLQEFIIKVGASAAIPKQSGARASAIVGRTSEGTEIVADFTPYNVITAVPYKVGMSLRIPREQIEDQIVNMIEDQLRRAARRLLMTIDQDVEAAFNTAVLSTQQFSATGNSISFSGTTTTLAGAIGVSDITKAKGIIQQNAIEPDTIAMNPLQHQDLASQPQFAGLLLYGQAVYQQGSGTTVNAPQIYGLKQVVTPNVPAGRAYILAAAGANYSAANAPLGYFVMKRPIAVDVWPDPPRDSIIVVVTSRYTPVITYPESIVQLIGLRTS